MVFHSRAWTLQELIAPLKANFFDENWTNLGGKLSLQRAVAKRTRIPSKFFAGESDIDSFSVAQKIMSWAAGRETTRVEDHVYILLGIFDINMPLMYGEKENAFIRLQ